MSSLTYLLVIMLVNLSCCHLSTEEGACIVFGLCDLDQPCGCGLICRGGHFGPNPNLCRHDGSAFEG